MTTLARAYCHALTSGQGCQRDADVIVMYRSGSGMVWEEGACVGHVDAMRAIDGRVVVSVRTIQKTQGDEQ